VNFDFSDDQLAIRDAVEDLSVTIQQPPNLGEI
jgi:hypothetical protein